MKSERTALAGWGGTAPSVATVIDVRPDELDDAGALLSQIGPRGAIARGLGRSYGDPAQNGGGTVIRLAAGRRSDPAPRRNGHDHGRRRREPRRAAAGDHPAGLVRARVARHALRHGRRRDRQRRPRQGPSRRRLVRRPRQRDGDAAGRREHADDHRRRPIPICGGRRSAGWASPGSSCGPRST